MRYFLQKFSIVLIIFAALPFCAEAATVIDEDVTITENTVWTAEQGPYLIGDAVTVRVEEGVELSIEPGAVIKLGKGTEMKVRGALSAQGTAEQPIVFTSLANDAVAGDSNGDGSATQPSGSWDGWELNVGDYWFPPVIPARVELKYVEMSYAYIPLWAADAISVLEQVIVHDSAEGPGFDEGESVEIRDLGMYDIDYYGLMFFDIENVVVERVVVDTVSTAIEVYDTASVQIDELSCTTVKDSCLMVFGVPYLSVAGLFVGPTTDRSYYPRVDLYDVSDAVLEDFVISKITDKNQSAIGVYNTNLTATNGALLGGAEAGIEVYGFRATSSVELVGVIVENFAYGLDISRASVQGNDVRFINNQYGILAYVDGDDELAIHNSIFEGNGVAVVNDDDTDAKQIDLRGNWWGSETGPYHVENNPAGAGEVVVGDVLFDPWLTVPPGEEETEVDSLLLQYAPKLQFHEDEMYFPMNVEPFIEASALWTKEGVPDSQVVSAEDLTVERFTEIAGTTDTSDYYLAYSDPDGGDIDLTSAFEKYTAMVESGAATSTVYGYRMDECYTDDFEKEHCFIVLQYWYFYAMNNWGEQGGFNNHEGDWESVFVFLDKLTELPQYVAYSAHHNDGDPSLNIFQYDSVRRDWSSDEVEKSGNTVTSFVALGSHANYFLIPNSGYYKVPGVLRDYNDEVSIDGEVKNISVLSSVDKVNFYKGTWGTDLVDVKSSYSGPKSPEYSDVSGIIRFAEPLRWAGIDKISEYVIENETTAVAFPSQGITMEFEESVPAGTSIESIPYNETVQFGTNLNEVNLLPQYWDFSTSLQNDSFSVDVTLPYSEEEAVVWGLDPLFASVYYYNESTGEWEIVPSEVSESTITFTTSHFSRYAIGAPKFQEFTDVTVQTHPRAYSQEDDTRTYTVTLASEEILPETMRMVVTDISEGATLTEPDGITTNGLPYIDVTIPAGQTTFETSLVFALPTEIPASDRANEQAQKENATSKQVTFDVDLYKFY